MNLDTFFEKFDEFADAPNAVQKMRELILELAVRGKLVEQDERDIRASVLLGEILTEKLRLKKMGKLKIETSISAVLSAEMLFLIPDSWEWVRLSDVTSLIQRGKSPDYVPANGLPVISQRCVQWTGLDLSFAKMISKESLGSYETYRFIRDEDLLWNSTGTGTIGRIVRVSDPPDKLVCDSHVTIVRCLYVVAEYIRIWLRSASVYGTMEINASGSTNQIELTAQMAKSQVLPLPPLAEQKRIVAKVDELMALCDRLEAQEEERKEKKRRLSRAAIARFAKKPTVGNLGLLFSKSYTTEIVDVRETILTLAVQGRLVQQNNNDVPPINSFPGLQVFSSQSKGIAETPLQWETCTYKSLTSLVTSGSRGWKEFYSKTGAIFIRTQNIKTDRLVLDDAAFVRLPKSTEGMRTQVLKDDILITITGANVTKTARVEEQIPEAYVSQHIALTRPRWSTMSQWLHLCFISHGSARGQLEKLSYGDKPGLNLDNIRDLIIPVPPLAEQKRIVAKVNELMALVDALEAELAESRVLSERLLDAAIAEVIENAQRHWAGQVFTQTSVADEELREAFLISRIVSKTADPGHPSGRFRRTKFSYLAHRRAGDDVTKHYIKKAAGPYSPWAKFDGPEDLARARGYVRDTKADPLEGMVAGKRVGEVEEQVTDPLIGEAVDWVMKNFHFETNDSLELLTTVDFAVVGLRKEGKEISREEIKKVIANSKDWTAKLKRELFSDENIDKALKRMAGVFQEMYGK
jgi:type I restriction enzyme, S subunit